MGRESLHAGAQSSLHPGSVAVAGTGLVLGHDLAVWEAVPRFPQYPPFAEQRGEVSKKGHWSGKGGFYVLLCHAMLYYAML